MGRKRVEELTDADIRHFKREIEGYKSKQSLFLILGFIFMILFIAALIGSILLGIGVYNRASAGDFTSAYVLFVFLDTFVGTLAGLFFIAFLAMFILRGALFGKKIENRLNLIEDYEEYKNNNAKLVE